MLSKNLLPNASFELDFGDTVPTNWGDTQNELALQLHLDLNPDEIGITQVPQVSPRSEAMDETVEGERAARVETEAALSPDETGESDSTAVGHLLSPMVSVMPCTPHTISVYARSDEASAKPGDWVVDKTGGLYTVPRFAQLCHAAFNEVAAFHIYLLHGRTGRTRCR